MSTVTQRIPNFLSGISQQPDNRKFPGQLKDCVNAFPDYALGLLKRPGGRFVAELPNATADGKWFSILRDPQEKYVAQYDDNVFRVWGLIDTTNQGPAGTPRVVDMGSNTGVPATCNLTDYLVIDAAGSGLADATPTGLATNTTGSGSNMTVDLVVAGGVVTTATINAAGTDYADGDTITLQDATYSAVSLTFRLGQQAALNAYHAAVTTRDTALDTLHEEQADYAEELANQQAAQQELFEVSYNYPTGDIDQDLVSGVAKKADGNYIVKRNNTVLYSSTTKPTGIVLLEAAGAGYTNGKSINVATTTDPVVDIVTGGSAGLADGPHAGVATTVVSPTGARTPSGLTVDITVDQGEVVSATINAAGSDYETGDVLQITGHVDAFIKYRAPSGLTVDIDVASNAITDVIIRNAGTNYETGDILTVTGGTGTVEYRVVQINTERTNEQPLLAAEGNQLFGLIIETEASSTDAALRTAETAMNTAQTAYNNAVTAVDNAWTIYNREVTNCAIAAIPANGYLNGATADDIELLTLNDYTFVLNKAKTVAFTPAQTTAVTNRACVTINVVGTGHYRIYLNGALAGSYNAGSGGDVDAILNDLSGDINGGSWGGDTFSTSIIGPNLIIETTGNTNFSISVIGAPSATAMTVFQDTVDTVADLPTQCLDGYKVRVVNSIDVDVDDMYVEFVADNGASGPGVWEETNGWEVSTTLDPLTMPHQLVRQADGSFQFSPITWEQRAIGDEETNPDPSFVGSTIDGIFFYRNRLGFLSRESVVLSKAGSYFDFFATTALTVTDDDPIDLSASSIRPVNLNYVRPTSIGLVMYSDTEQFLLTTDSDILSPKTSKINELSSYECDPDVKAVGLGTTQAFITKTPLYTRLYELADISTDRPPNMYEQTRIVPELIPQTIDSMVASPALSIVSMGTTGSNVVYQFKFAQQGDQRAVSTWYRWTLTGTLLDQFFDFNEYYAVVSAGNEVYIQSYDLTQASESGFLTLPTGERTDVCMDLWNVNPYRTYDSANDTTRVFLPYNEVDDATFSVVALGNYIGSNPTVTTSASVGAVINPTVTSTVANTPPYYVDLTGDYRGRDLIIGYNYNMEVELPKFFVTEVNNQTSKSDFTSDLIIHRIKVSTGLTGPIQYRIDITGRPEWSNTVEPVQPYSYNFNNVNLAAESIQTVPIYQRNENLSITLVGNTPLPVSLLSLNWEGKYNTGFYRRA